MYTVLVLLGSILAVFAGGHYGVIPSHGYIGGLGYAVNETPKPYQFAYQAEAIGGASIRQESADGSGTVVGSYSLSDEDGRKRVVDYVADGSGFRASVKTNEPGTKNESPADVSTLSEAIDIPVAHVATAYSGAYRSPYHGAYGGYPYGGYSNALGYGRSFGGTPLPCGGRCSGSALPCGGRCSACGGRCAAGRLGAYGLLGSGRGLGYGGPYH